MTFSLSRPGRASCAIGLSALLAACGGGGGGDGAPRNDRPCCYDYISFVAPPPQIGTDQLLNGQWHLYNYGQGGGTAGEDLNVAGPAGAWALGTKGDGVRVAIVDNAVEVVHPDLAPNFDATRFASYYNYRFPGQLPLPYYLDQEEGHGTSVAGIAVARDENVIGGAGVAPRASLGAYNALATSNDADIADALRRDPAVTGVYNNSWGSPDNGVLNAAEYSFVKAVTTGVEGDPGTGQAPGRGGLGSIYVFPAGNGGNGGRGKHVRDLLGNPIDENSNFDGYVNKRAVIATCAVDDRGIAPTYSEPGANILVCGRSGNDRVGIITTKPQGEYRSDFSGTSASTPMVSGVVALMLKERPALTWRDVRLILAKTARENQESGWVSSSLTDASGLPKHFHPKYGFGAVDAAAAVTLARSWSSVDGGSPRMKSCSVPVSFAMSKALDSTKPPASDSILITGSCPITRVEFVEVNFSATHTYSGDLRIELISPIGHTSTLATERLCLLDDDNVADSCGNYDNWQFGSVRHLDETAVGLWTLRVTDVQPGDTGAWTSWRLTVWGR